jgi:predicted Fe-Mo cluster-binding NifX family protein
MLRTLAIPIFGTRVSSRLDCSDSVLIVTVDAGIVVRRHEMRWTDASIPERVHRLVVEDVCILICGGLSNICAHLLKDNNIQVIPWVRGNAEEVLLEFLLGTLHTVTEEEHCGKALP